ncbi:hypothetical protein H0H87_006238 [Tephrocybe sp. NHM501043]|nr:hypothetical protein H0H87_006238 [Tephrocybe sp. NHM501043]
MPVEAVMPNRRYHAVAEKLTTLSPEILHKVLDDLPLLKILEVISIHDLPYVESCILSHFHYSQIFRTPQSLSKLKQYFTLYVELCQRRQGRHSSGNPEIATFTQDAIRLVNQKKNVLDYSEKLLAKVKLEVLSLLKVYEPYMNALSHYSEPSHSIASGVPDVSDPVALRHFWLSLDKAEGNLNLAKSAQLLRIARLYAEYPGTLRSRLDTSQESRILSDQHCIKELQIRARRMSKPQILRGHFVANAVFAEQRFPVTPYDRHLKTFLRILEKFPVDNLSLSLSIATGRRRPIRPYPWPTEVANDVKRVVEGLAYVYPKATATGGDYPPVLRTKNTRFSDKEYSISSGLRQPCFSGGLDSESQKQRRLPFYVDSDNILPLEEREFEWLEAFLRGCRYMGKMEDAEWSPGLTVKQFWCIHTGDILPQF